MEMDTDTQSGEGTAPAMAAAGSSTRERSKRRRIGDLRLGISAPVSDSPKIHHFWRIRHAPADTFEESEQLSLLYAPLGSTVHTGNANEGDWREEVYEKIKSMKEMYLAKLNALYQKIADRVQQESVHQRLQNEQIEKLKMFKLTLGRILLFLQFNKQDIEPSHKEKLAAVERHINFFLSSSRPRSKPSSSSLQGQLPQSSMQPGHGSMAAMPQNNLTNLQHNSLSGIPIISNSRQHMIYAVQPGSGVVLGQGNSLNSLQQVAAGSLQQNHVNSLQLVNLSLLSSQSGTSRAEMLQIQQLRQQQLTRSQQLMLQQLEQQLLQNQLLRELYHHRQLILQREQLMQQHRANQQQSMLLPTHQMSQLQQSSRQRQQPQSRDGRN